jgi:hypothetical protein
MALAEKLCFGVVCRGFVNKPIAMFKADARYPDGYSKKCSDCLQAEQDAVDADRNGSKPATGPQWTADRPPAASRSVPKKESPAPPVPVSTAGGRTRSKTGSLPDNFVELVDTYRARGDSWRTIGDVFRDKHGCDAGWTNISQMYRKCKRAGTAASAPAPAAPAARAEPAAKVQVEPEVQGEPASLIETDGPHPGIDAREEQGRILEEQRALKEEQAAYPGPRFREPVPPPPPADRIGMHLAASGLDAEQACTLREAIKLFEEKARQLEVEANNYRDMARRTREMIEHG